MHKVHSHTCRQATPTKKKKKKERKKYNFKIFLKKRLLVFTHFPKDVSSEYFPGVHTLTFNMKSDTVVTRERKRDQGVATGAGRDSSNVPGNDQHVT